MGVWINLCISWMDHPNPLCWQVAWNWNLCCHVHQHLQDVCENNHSVTFADYLIWPCILHAVSSAGYDGRVYIYIYCLPASEYTTFIDVCILSAYLSVHLLLTANSIWHPSTSTDQNNDHDCRGIWLWHYLSSTSWRSESTRYSISLSLLLVVDRISSSGSSIVDEFAG